MISAAESVLPEGQTKIELPHSNGLTCRVPPGSESGSFRISEDFDRFFSRAERELHSRDV
jgi:hypothetical protein